jgi:excisionase family DNA binding protein
LLIETVVVHPTVITGLTKQQRWHGRVFKHASLDADLVAAEVLPRKDFDAGVGIEPGRDLLSVSEAARTLGVSGARVRQLLEVGQLAGTKVGATWVVECSAMQTTNHRGRLSRLRGV